MLNTARAGLRWDLLLAFLAVYLVWGSTYLAIHVAIDTMPPLLMLGARFGLAGLLLYGWLALRGRARATARQWGAAALLGGLMLSVGTGTVAWAELYVPTGLAALVITTTPLWMVLLGWLWQGEGRPGGRTLLGLVMGLAGVLLLLDPASFRGAGGLYLPAVFAILAGTLAWAAGSLLSKRVDLPRDPFLGTALQMLAGGGWLVLAGLLAGEGRHVNVAAFTWASVGAWAYLVVFGSIVAFSAYVWLLRHVSTAAVSTHAYVNPLVAVLLGWLLLGEPLTLRMGGAGLLLILSVGLLSWPRSAGPPRRRPRRALAWPRRPRRPARRRALAATAA